MFSVRSLLIRLANRAFIQTGFHLKTVVVITNYNKETKRIPGVGIEPTTPFGDQNLSLAP